MQAIVFVVGGGNYIEYQNLLDYQKYKGTTSAKKISYGCTEINNGNEFLLQVRRQNVWFWHLILGFMADYVFMVTWPTK